MNSLERHPKWKVFKEKVLVDDHPLWVVWTGHFEEFLFQSGADALSFVREAFAHKAHNHDLGYCPETIVSGRVVGRCLNPQVKEVASGP